MNKERTGWRDEELSARHRTWGENCPAVDLDFLMCEFNRGVPVAVVDYKRYTANMDNVDERVMTALSGFYNIRQEQLPFFVVRYWPDVWAFEVFPKNLPACDALKAESRMLTERQYVWFLYWLRKTTLTEGDKRYIARCNDSLPPEQGAAA